MVREKMTFVRMYFQSTRGFLGYICNIATTKLSNFTNDMYMRHWVMHEKFVSELTRRTYVTHFNERRLITDKTK